MSPISENITSESYTQKTFFWLVGVYSSFALTLVIVVCIASWGVYVDFQETRTSLLQAEVNRLRSHALRTVIRIQDILASEPGTAGEPLKTLKNAEWLREHWNRFIPSDEARLYAAVVDSKGRVVMHHYPKLEGESLEPGRYQRPIQEVGDDVFENDDADLTGGAPALDIVIPILNGNREVGSYHSGFNVRWFEGQLAQKRVATTRRWVVAFALIAGVIVLAGISLYRVTRRLSVLQSAVSLGQVRRLADLGQLAGGIAHEVRNPLSAIRLNLHVIQKLIDRRSSPGDDADNIIRETVFEMERIDGLLQSLLNYARPERAFDEVVNVTHEVRGVVGFLQPIFVRDGVSLQVDLKPETLMANLDRNRLRQIILNLLKNALEAVGTGGSVCISVQQTPGFAEISVRDDGPGILPSDSSRIFEPFFTTKEMGTGLGMTLVKRYVEEAGGMVEHFPGELRGTVFVVRLPLAAPAQAKPDATVVVSATSRATT